MRGGIRGNSGGSSPVVVAAAAMTQVMMMTTPHFPLHPHHHQPSSPPSPSIRFLRHRSRYHNRSYARRVGKINNNNNNNSSGNRRRRRVSSSIFSLSVSSSSSSSCSSYSNILFSCLWMMMLMTAVLQQHRTSGGVVMAQQQAASYNTACTEALTAADADADDLLSEAEFVQAASSMSHGALSATADFATLEAALVDAYSSAAAAAAAGGSATTSEQVSIANVSLLDDDFCASIYTGLVTALGITTTTAQCYLALSIGDSAAGRDDLLVELEFPVFVNYLSSNFFGAAGDVTMDALPDYLQNIFTEFSSTAGGPASIDITGTKPGQTPSAELAPVMESLCAQTVVGVAAAKGGGVVVAPPSPTAPAVVPSPTAAVPATTAAPAASVPASTSAPVAVPIPATSAPIAAAGEPATSAPVPATSPGATPSVGESPIITLEMCISTLAVSDLNRNDYLSTLEYFSFVNRLAKYQYSSLSYDTLPQPLQDNYVAHGDPTNAATGEINVAGSKSWETPSVEQEAARAAFCTATGLALGEAESATPPPAPAPSPDSGGSTPAPAPDAGGGGGGGSPTTSGAVKEIPYTTCTLSMAVSDANPRNTQLDAAEYVDFINKVSQNAYKDATTYDLLPAALQENYKALADTEAEGMDVEGSFPGTPATPEQTTHLENICEKTAAALHLAANGGGATEPPVDGATPEPGGGGDEKTPVPGRHGEDNDDDETTLMVYNAFIISNTQNLRQADLMAPSSPYLKALDTAYGDLVQETMGSYLLSTNGGNQTLNTTTPAAAAPDNSTTPSTSTTRRTSRRLITRHLRRSFGGGVSSRRLGSVTGLSTTNLPEIYAMVDEACPDYVKAAAAATSPPPPLSNATTAATIATSSNATNATTTVGANETAANTTTTTTTTTNSSETPTANVLCQRVFGQFTADWVSTPEDNRDATIQLLTKLVQEAIGNVVTGGLQTHLDAAYPESGILVQGVPEDGVLEPPGTQPPKVAPTPSPPPSDSSGMSVGVIIGIVVGGVLLIALVASYWFCFAKGSKGLLGDGGGGGGGSGKLKTSGTKNDDDNSAHSNDNEANMKPPPDNDDVDTFRNEPTTPSSNRGMKLKMSRNDVDGFFDAAMSPSGRDDRDQDDDDGTKGEGNFSVRDDGSHLGPETAPTAGGSKVFGAFGFGGKDKRNGRNGTDGFDGDHSESNDYGVDYGFDDPAANGDSKSQGGSDWDPQKSPGQLGGPLLDPWKNGEGEPPPGYAPSVMSTSERSENDESGSYDDDDDDDDDSEDTSGSDTYLGDGDEFDDGASRDDKVKDNMEGFDDMVDNGDWDGVMEAAGKLDPNSDEGTYVAPNHGSTAANMLKGIDDDRTSRSKSRSNRAGDGSENRSPSRQGSEDGFGASYSSMSMSSEDRKLRSQYKDEIEDLVKKVVPNESDNVSAMMKQFQGREPELINTLRAMYERSSSIRARKAVHKSKGIPDSAHRFPAGGAEGSAAVAAASTIGSVSGHNKSELGQQSAFGDADDDGGEPHEDDDYSDNYDDGFGAAGDDAFGNDDYANNDNRGNNNDDDAGSFSGSGSDYDDDVDNNNAANNNNNDDQGSFSGSGGGDDEGSQSHSGSHSGQDSYHDEDEYDDDHDDGGPYDDDDYDSGSGSFED
jgi:hypothetical protein